MFAFLLLFSPILIGLMSGMFGAVIFLNLKD